MKISIEKKSLVGFGLATAVLVGINALSYWSFNKNREIANWVAHTQQMRQNIQSTLADIESAEAGQRGYVITGVESYLQSYYESVASIRQQIRDIQTLTANNPSQQQRINFLKPLVEKRVAALWQVIDLRRSKGFDAARVTITAGQETELMTRIREALNEMENEEASLLKQRLSQQQAAIRTQNLVFLAGILFNVVVFYWLYSAINREIQRRSQEQATVQKVNEELEQKVTQRTVALEDKIIALQQTKAALNNSYNLLRSVIDASPHPIFVKDLQGRYQLMNISGASRFNKQPEEELIDEQQARIGNKHHLSFTHVGEESQFLGDVMRLQQIFTNLIDNAIKYSPRGGTVSVHLALEETQVILSCLDEGIGIPVEDQQELFKSFSRASNVGTIGGTGLGLSIVKKCVDLHSGLISVDSVVGEGTKFTVTLPRKHG